MYEDFVAHLRDEAGALDYGGWVATACDYERAANIIEELSAKLSAYEKTGVKPEEVDTLARTISKQRMALGFSTVEEFQSFLDKMIEDEYKARVKQMLQNPMSCPIEVLPLEIHLSAPFEDQDWSACWVRNE